MSASKVIRVVLLLGTESDAPQGSVLRSESTPLGNLLAEAGVTVDLNVISLGTSRALVGTSVHLRLDQASRSVTDRTLRAIGGYALSGRFDLFPVGRLLNSLGPISPSRVFWRVLKLHPEAMSLLRSSDIVIATDLETTKAAWLAVHRGWVGGGYYDHRAVSFISGAPASTSPSP